MKLIDTNINNLKKINIIILSFIVAVIPLIVRMYLVILDWDLRVFWGNLIHMDFFSFYKMNWLLLMSAGLLIAFLLYYFKYKEKIIKTYYYLPIFIYLSTVVLSAVFSDYSFVFTPGFPGRYENFFVLIAYLLLTVVAMNLIDDRDSLKVLLGTLFISAFLLGVHGILQFLGLEPLNTELGRRLITPTEFAGMIEAFGFRYPEGRIYSTMFNPNYVGSYGSMLVILTLGIYLTSKHKKVILIIGSLSVLMFAFLVGSISRAGMVGFLVGLMTLILLLRRIIQKNLFKTVIILFVFLVVLFAMDVYSVDDVLHDIVFPVTEPDLIEEEVEVPPITNISTDNHTLIIKTEAVTINLIKDDGYFHIRDSESNNISYEKEQNSGRIFLTESGYLDHSFKINSSQDKIKWKYDNIQATFKQDDNSFYMLGMNYDFYKIQDVEKWGFEGYERLGSSRGYIWSRSLPILRDTLILGHGPDSFAFYFPQEDVVGKLRFLSNAQMMVDKPHNMYLQTAINTGLFSLLALLTLWGVYLLQGIRLYWNSDFNCWQARTGVAVMAAVAAYLATGFFNDSVVSVAPVFWILFGIGLGMNIRLKRNLI